MDLAERQNQYYRRRPRGQRAFIRLGFMREGDKHFYPIRSVIEWWADKIGGDEGQAYVNGADPDTEKPIPADVLDGIMNKTLEEREKRWLQLRDELTAHPFITNRRLVYGDLVLLLLTREQRIRDLEAKQ